MLEQLRKLPPVAPTTVVTNPSRMKRKGTQNKKKPRNLIKETKPTPENNQPKEEKQDGDNSEEMNPISRLIQIQQAKKEKEPVYMLKEERGAPRRREFLIEVSNCLFTQCRLSQIFVKISQGKLKSSQHFKSTN